MEDLKLSARSRLLDSKNSVRSRLLENVKTQGTLWKKRSNPLEIASLYYETWFKCQHLERAEGFLTFRYPSSGLPGLALKRFPFC